MALIRGVRPGDLEALYAICLATGDNGQDASAQHDDSQVVGHIYAAPYAVLEPGSAFVVEDGDGVAGYIVGAADTLAFEERMVGEWWPALRGRYADPGGDPRAWNADQVRAYQIHHPQPPPARVTDAYPSHLHINLLPRLQGQGLGRRLIDTWLTRMRELGSSGAHLGVGVKNERAVRFYRAYGLTEFQFPNPRPDAQTRYFVADLR
ncbi:MAG: GNAT family N-acetyltransferase [Caulobacterales bacterium]